jgi:hypothetical protein
METSEHINELAAALAVAQGELPSALKTAVNDAFKRNGKGSRYATLDDCVKAAHPVLSKHKLCIIQGVHGHEFVARLAHASGQWTQIRVPLPDGISTIQQLVGCNTYMRRMTYSLVGLSSDDDDDGNEAAKAGTYSAAKPGIGIHSPLGDTTQTLSAQLYASNFKAAFENDDALKAGALHKDLHAEGEEAYRNAWALLDSKCRTWVKKAIEASKEVA